MIKLVRKDPGAHREVLLEDLAGTPNVIPILDTGELDNYWLLAMPRAERSLQDYLRMEGPALGADEAVRILIDVSEALAALEGRVVHRDLKPSNILLWEGRWCLADFGIARYAEQTTAPDTRKQSMTPPYAAPEQWRAERGSSKTDVYALGVTAYEVLKGERPFPGPSAEDYREQHLVTVPPPLEDVPEAVAALVAACLLKSPEARPSPGAVLNRLRGTAGRNRASAAASRLQQAELAATQVAAQAAAAEQAGRHAADRRKELHQAALMLLRPIHDALREELTQNAPSAAPPQPHEWPFKLNAAELTWVPVREASPSAWGSHVPAFEVISHAGLELKIPPSRSGYHGRGHSLWYCDAQEKGVFRWYETAFMLRASVNRRTKGNPVLLSPGLESGGALSRTTTEWRVAWPFTAIEDDMSEFIERWLGWFADASQGLLQHPRHMPERDPLGSFRLP